MKDKMLLAFTQTKINEIKIIVTIKNKLQYLSLFAKGRI